LFYKKSFFVRFDLRIASFGPINYHIGGLKLQLTITVNLTRIPAQAGLLTSHGTARWIKPEKGVSHGTTYLRING
jgi:hypothetical protein